MKVATLASVAVLFGASLVTASPLARRDAAQIQASICAQSVNGDQGKMVSCACESSTLSAMSTCATCLGSAEGDVAKS
ncbi:hypothetical protein RTBOTA2_002854 [Rhodotorula toruloides]|nr:hypothetical protein RTBOTA2_002854 [Rhodotorula toruloides]